MALELQLMYDSWRLRNSDLGEDECGSYFCFSKSMRSLRFANATVEMTYKEKASFNSQTLKVNKHQKYFIHNKKFT